MISIITPTYNHEKFIAECIESVMVQTYEDWEMIIIDDGSTDGTGEVVAGFKDPRIRYVRQENKGLWRLAETYNGALGMARGDLVAILEGDDYWPHYKLKMQALDFDDENIVLSFGSTAQITPEWAKIIANDDIPVESKTNDPVGSAAVSMMDPAHLTFTFPVSVIMRRSALERIGGFRQPSYLPLVDYPTFLALSTEGRFAFHSEVLGFWRRHGNSATQSSFPVILNGVGRYVVEFLKEHEGLYGKDVVERVTKFWRDNSAYRWLLLGRLFLHEGERDKALRAFRKGLELNSSVYDWKLKVSAWFARMNLNLERCFGMFRLPTIETLLSFYPDPIIDKKMLREEDRKPRGSDSVA